MTDSTIEKNGNHGLKKMVLITLLIMLILVLAGHIILPLLGITLAITTGIWSFAIATVVLLCIATLLFFIFTGIGIFLFGIFAVAWAIGVMIVFPLLFPIIIPVLLVMLIIGFIARRR